MSFNNETGRWVARNIHQKATATVYNIKWANFRSGVSELNDGLTDWGYILGSPPSTEEQTSREDGQCRPGRGPVVPIEDAALFQVLFEAETEDCRLNWEQCPGMRRKPTESKFPTVPAFPNRITDRTFDSLRSREADTWSAASSTACSVSMGRSFGSHTCLEIAAIHSSIGPTSLKIAVCESYMQQ